MLMKQWKPSFIFIRITLNWHNEIRRWDYDETIYNRDFYQYVRDHRWVIPWNACFGVQLSAICFSFISSCHPLSRMFQKLTLGTGLFARPFASTANSFTCPAQLSLLIRSQTPEWMMRYLKIRLFWTIVRSLPVRCVGFYARGNAAPLIRLLARSWAHGKKVLVHEMNASISSSFNPLCLVLFFVNTGWPEANTRCAVWRRNPTPRRTASANRLETLAAVECCLKETTYGVHAAVEAVTAWHCRTNELKQTLVRSGFFSWLKSFI